jgi:hypothetical protein
MVRNFAGLDPSAPLSLSQAAMAGFISAVPTTAIMTPVERLKVMIQMPNSPYKSLGQAFRGAWTEGGVRSLFRGGVATLVRDGPGSMAYFAAYEWFKRALTPAGSSPSVLSPGAVMFAGGMAGIANWAVAIVRLHTSANIQSRLMLSSLEFNLLLLVLILDFWIVHEKRWLLKDLEPYSRDWDQSCFVHSLLMLHVSSESKRASNSSTNYFSHHT